MNKELKEELCNQIEEQISIIKDQGINPNNLEMLGDLVDIKKDISNMDYWKKKEEVMDMRYRGDYGNYGTYGRRTRDSRGRYSEGPMTRQEIEEAMNDMHRSLKGYSEGKEQYSRGNYGAKEDTMKSLEYMLESMVDFVEMLKEDATSQEEVELIKHYTKKISEM